MLSAVLFVLGALAIVAGVACWSIPAALIVAGVALLAAGVLFLTVGDGGSA